jgi:hypothetical protein
MSWPNVTAGGAIGNPLYIQPLNGGAMTVTYTNGLPTSAVRVLNGVSQTQNYSYTNGLLTSWTDWT